MMRIAATCAVALLVLVALVPRDALAQSTGPILTFESHVGSRSKEDARYLDQLAERLELHGFAARPASIRKLVPGRVPRPGIADRSLTLIAIADRVNLGFNAFISSRFDDAVTELSSALELIQTNPALVVMDTKNASMMLKAFIGLALSQQRLSQTAASEATMAELIRTFAGQPISRAEYGADAAAFHRSVLKRLQSEGRGSLTIKTGDERALIFVDEQLRGVGTIAIGDLIPGPYRILVQLPGTSGHRYEVDIKANEDAYLDIAVAIESHLTINDAWIGFVFGNDAERASEARYAAELARRWGRQDSVAVIGTTTLQGKRVVIATLYRADGEVLRAAVINVDDSTEERVRSLAKFMADGTPDQALGILHGGEQPEEPPATPRQSRSLLGPVLTVSGAVGVAAGIVIYAFDEDPSPTGGPKYWDTAPAGVIVGAMSAVALGVGIWLWLRRPASRTQPTVTATRDGGSVGFALRF